MSLAAGVAYPCLDDSNIITASLANILTTTVDCSYKSQPQSYPQPPSPQKEKKYAYDKSQKLHSRRVVLLLLHVKQLETPADVIILLVCDVTAAASKPAAFLVAQQDDVIAAEGQARVVTYCEELTCHVTLVGARCNQGNCAREDV